MKLVDTVVDLYGIILITCSINLDPFKHGIGS
jgi:hypothetical protein